MSKEKIKIILKKISSLKKKVNKISQNNETELLKKKLLKVSIIASIVIIIFALLIYNFLENFIS